MNRAVVHVALGMSLLALSAFAKDDLTTVKGFEAAYRRAHDTGNVRALESLVCWDRTTTKMRRDMRETLRVGLELEIAHIEIIPFASGKGAFKMPHNVNLQPTHVFTVWYKHEGLVGTSYLIAKKIQRFYFAVSSDWRPIIRMPPVLAYASAKSNQSMQPTAGQCDSSVTLTSALPLQFALAIASGG
jgi:hypothetical protein